MRELLTVLSFYVLPSIKLPKDVIPGVPGYLDYEQFVTYLLGLHCLDRDLCFLINLSTDKIAQKHISLFSSVFMTFFVSEGG